MIVPLCNIRAQFRFLWSHHFHSYLHLLSHGSLSFSLSLFIFFFYFAPTVHFAMQHRMKLVFASFVFVFAFFFIFQWISIQNVDPFILCHLYAVSILFISNFFSFFPFPTRYEYISKKFYAQTNGQLNEFTRENVHCSHHSSLHYVATTKMTKKRTHTELFQRPTKLWPFLFM